MLEKIKLFTVTYSSTKFYAISKNNDDEDDFMFIIWDGWNPELQMEIHIFFALNNYKNFFISIDPGPIKRLRVLEKHPNVR